MALLPSGYVFGTTGDSATPTEKPDGGTIVGITSATDTTNGPITQTFPFYENALGGREKRSVPKAVSGEAHAFSAQKAYSAGTFAYDPTNSQFTIRTVADKINNVSNTTLLIPGNAAFRTHRHVSNKSKGAKTSTAYRAGYWNALGVSEQRTNWTTAPSSNNVNYVLPTNNGSNADDQAIYVTYKSVPGELAYMYGAIDPLQDEYPARNL